MRNLLIILTFFCTLSSLQASVNVFLGSVNERWHNPSNWSKGYVPTIAEDVHVYLNDIVIPKGFDAVARDVIISAKRTLMIEAGASLNSRDIGAFDGTIINYGLIESRNFSIGSNPYYDPDKLGFFINKGLLKFKDLPYSVMNIRHGEVINSGAIIQSHHSGYYDFIHVSATSQFVNFGSIEKFKTAKRFLNNEGLFINEKTGEILFFKGKHPQPNPVYNPIVDNKNTIINKGSIILDEDSENGFLTGLNMYSGSVFINEKEAFFSIANARIFPIALQNNSVFHNYGMARFRPADDTNKMIRNGNSSNAEFINFSGSYFQGGGEIDNVEVLFEEVIIDPMEDNHLLGKIIFSEKVELNNSIYKCQIRGTAGGGNANGHDQIHTLKLANIDGGNIDVTLSGGFVPSINDEFIIFSSNDEIVGNIDGVNLPNLPAGRAWDGDITSNEIILRVVASSSNYISQNQNQIFEDINSVNSNELDSEVFPNPFSNLVNIDVPADEFEIYNSLGKVIYQSNTGKEKVDLSSQATGVYFVQYEKNGKLNIEKIIKIK